MVGGFSCGCGSWEVVSCAGVLVMSLPHLLSGILSSWTPYCGTLIPMGDIKYHARLNGSQYFAAPDFANPRPSAPVNEFRKRKNPAPMEHRRDRQMRIYSDV